MTKFFFAAMAVGAAAVLSGTGATAATVTVATDEGSQQLTEYGIRTRIIDGVEEYYTSTYGVDLVGMQLMAGYADGTSETLTWQDLSSGSNRLGGASSARMSLNYESSEWTLTTNSLLTSLKINAATGNALFDILRAKKDGEDGDTIGTKIGFEYHEVGGDALEGDIGVAYSNGVILKGYERGTDIFTRMAVDYSGLFGGGLLGTTIFRSDLDSLKVAGDLTPVPLPAGLPLLATGLGLMALRRKRRD